MVRAGRSCAVVAASAVFALVGCGAAEQPRQPTPVPPSASVAPSPSATPAPIGPALTLRQLGFENGPQDEFTLPSDVVISTRVDQPNAVTLILARPSPQAIEEHLRAMLPAAGFTIDARARAGQTMTFQGHGWTGGYTGSGTTTAIVLRPA